MAKRSGNNLSITVAGPGAGKTHCMVDQIVESLRTLRPHRHLAAITYTNAAARTIRERLFRHARPPKNVFIGTTHRFLNRFILHPFATVFDHLPSERLYGAIDVEAIVTKGGTKTVAPSQKSIARAAVTKRLVNKGVVPYDAMLSIANQLLKNKQVRDRVAARLQFLFIDEFQDTDTRQLNVFDQLRIAKKTQIFAVGDPEQYVTGFTYGARGQRHPEFEKIPFFTFLEKAVPVKEQVNRRANGELVDFANQFRDDLQQKAKKPHRGEPRVLFLDSSDLDAAVGEFIRRSDNIECEEEFVSRLYLGFANNTFDGIRDKYCIVPVSNESRKANTLLGDSLELLALTLGTTPRKVMEEHTLTRLQWRRDGITLLRQCQAKDFDVDALYSFVKDRYSAERSTTRQEAIQSSLTELKCALTVPLKEKEPHRCSSINKAKGLEADAVLAVARTTNELNKWLTIDRKARAADKVDTCRLGYVAMTRPRELLCFTCLKPLDSQTRKVLQERGVCILSPSSPTA